MLSVIKLSVVVPTAGFTKYLVGQMSVGQMCFCPKFGDHLKPVCKALFNWWKKIDYMLQNNIDSLKLNLVQIWQKRPWACAIKLFTVIINSVVL
jgi:hypothetical protein